MSKAILIAICLILCVETLGWAEFYQYRDAAGVIRFTDDPAKVPADQRESAKRYNEAVSPQPPIPDTASQGEISGQAGPGPAGQPPTPDLGIEAQLTARKAELDREYNTLQQQIETLQREKDTIAPHAYNDSAMALNQKITEYEARRAEFEKDMKAYRDRSGP